MTRPQWQCRDMASGWSPIWPRITSVSRPERYLRSGHAWVPLDHEWRSCLAPSRMWPAMLVKVMR